MRILLKKITRITFYTLALYLTVILLFLALAPTLLSISPIKEYVLRTFASPYINKEIRIEELKLSWFGKQEASKLSLFNKEGKAVASIDSLTVHNSLIHLLFFDRKLTEIEIREANALLDDSYSDLFFETPILVQDLSLFFRLGNARETFKLTGNGKILSTVKGDFHINAEFKNSLFNCQRECAGDILSLQGVFNHVPTHLLQYGFSLISPHYELQLKEILGEEFSATFNQSRQEEINTLLFELHAPLSQSYIEIEMTQDAILLKQPAYFQLHTQKETLSPLEISVDKLQVPLRHSELPFELQGTFTANALNYGSLELKDINGAIENSHFSFHATILGEDRDETILHFNSDFKMRSSHLFYLPQFTILLQKNSLPSLLMQGDLLADFSAALGHGVQINCVTQTLLPPEWSELYIGSFSDYEIERQPLQVRLSINKTIIPYSPPLIQQIYSEGGILIQEVRLQETSEHNLFKLSNLSMRWSVDGSKNKASLRFKTHLHYLGEEPPNKIRFNTNIAHWHHQGEIDLMSSHLDAEARLPDIPTGFFGLLLNQPSLKEVIGPLVRLHFKINYYPNQQQENLLEFGISSQAINAFGELIIGEEIRLRDLDEPLTLEWTLTPQRSQILRKLFAHNHPDLRPLELLNDTKLKISVEDLAFKWPKQTQKLLYALSDGAMTLQFRFTPFSINDPNNETQTHFEKIFGEIVTKPYNSIVAFTMKSKGTNGPERRRFDSVVTGYFDEAFHEDGTLATERITFSLSSTHKRSPLSLLSEFLFPTTLIARSISPLIGEYVDGHFELKTNSLHEGLFNANLSGENGQFKASGEIKNKYLTLNQPLTASLKVTPQLGKSVLQYINPLFSALSHADAPIKLHVPQEGLRIPLTSGSVNHLNIPSITLEIGKVYFNNVDSVNSILEVLNHSASSKVSIWLLPIITSIKEGQLTVSRADLLIDEAFPLAMWGKVDLIKDKVKMNLGLTPIALYRSHHIEIPDDTLFIFPIIGSTAHPSIDLKKIAARMASRSLKNQGLEGQLPALALDLLTGNFNEKQPPPPTTPLPWEVNLSNHSENKSTIQNSAEKVFKFLNK